MDRGAHIGVIAAVAEGDRGDQDLALDVADGDLAVLVGPIAAIVAGGAGAIVVTGLWSRLFPQLGAAKTFDPPDELEPAENEKINRSAG